MTISQPGGDGCVTHLLGVGDGSGTHLLSDEEEANSDGTESDEGASTAGENHRTKKRRKNKTQPFVGWTDETEPILFHALDARRPFNAQHGQKSVPGQESLSICRSMMSGSKQLDDHGYLSVSTKESAKENGTRFTRSKRSG